LNLGANSIWVGQPLHCARNLIVETRPTATSFELVLRPIKRRTTPLANINAAFPEGIVFACERRFRAFMHNDIFLLLSQLPALGFFLIHGSNLNISMVFAFI
jgi:hypothetical protein